MDTHYITTKAPPLGLGYGAIREIFSCDLELTCISASAKSGTKDGSVPSPEEKLHLVSEGLVCLCLGSGGLFYRNTGFDLDV